MNDIAIELYVQYITSAIICTSMLHIFDMATPTKFPKNYAAKSHLQRPTDFLNPRSIERDGCLCCRHFDFIGASSSGRKRWTCVMAHAWHSRLWVSRCTEIFGVHMGTVRHIFTKSFLTFLPHPIHDSWMHLSATREFLLHNRCLQELLFFWLTCTGTPEWMWIEWNGWFSGLNTSYILRLVSFWYNTHTMTRKLGQWFPCRSTHRQGSELVDSSPEQTQLHLKLPIHCPPVFCHPECRTGRNSCSNSEIHPSRRSFWMCKLTIKKCCVTRWH